MKRKSCAFTGHRPKLFPWGYDENDARCVELKKVLAHQIHLLVCEGYTDYLSGMAIGVDSWAAQIVLALREKEPSLKLHCILPCWRQEKSWSEEAKSLYFSVIKQADSRVYTSRTYYQNCMLDRNKFMVDHSSLLFAVYGGVSGGGTAFTVEYARKQRREIIVLDPLTLNVTHEKNAPEAR